MKNQAFVDDFAGETIGFPHVFEMFTLLKGGAGPVSPLSPCLTQPCPAMRQYVSIPLLCTSCEELGNMTGWWFGTMEFYFSHHIGNVIIPTDKLIFFKRG